MAAPAQTSHGTTRASAAKSGRKRLKALKVDPTDNGGFIVRHVHHQEYGGTPKTEKHAFGDAESMHAHLEKTMREHK